MRQAILHFMFGLEYPYFCPFCYQNRVSADLPDSTSLIENRLKMEGTDILGALSSFQLPVESTTDSNMTTKEESNSPTLGTNEELASYVC